MKKIFIIAAALFIGHSSFAADPTQKVLEAFNKTFNNAKDVTWNEIDDTYEANFSHNDVSLRVLYDGEGNILKSIRYYKAQGLPIFLQAKLAKKYEGKKIFGVTETTSSEDLNYYIILEDAENWIHVQSDAYGNMSTAKKLKKA